jgi:hypothetical protein
MSSRKHFSTFVVSQFRNVPIVELESTADANLQSNFIVEAANHPLLDDSEMVSRPAELVNRAVLDPVAAKSVAQESDLWCGAR